MKTRNGFVSNSSSSSFVIIVPKKVADKVVNQYTPYEKEYINFVRKNKKFMGKDVSIFAGSTGSQNSWDCDSDSDFDFTKEIIPHPKIDETYYGKYEDDIKEGNRIYLISVWDEFRDKLEEVAGEDLITEEMDF
jgi:hypothetical protein